MCPSSSWRSACAVVTIWPSGVLQFAIAYCAPRLSPNVYHQNTSFPGATQVGVRALLNAIGFSWFEHMHVRLRTTVSYTRLASGPCERHHRHEGQFKRRGLGGAREAPGRKIRWTVNR